MSNKNIPTCLGTVILVIIAITAGVFVWVYEKGQDQETVSMQTRPALKQVVKNQPQTDISTTQSDDTEKWNTYTDDILGYDVQYPQGYIIQRYDPPCNSRLNNENGKNVTIQMSDTTNKDYTSLDDDIKSGKIINFNIFVNDPEDVCILNAYSSIGGPQAQTPKLLDSENVTLGKHAVLKRTYAHLDPEGKLSSYRFSTWRFNENEKYYTLMFNNGLQITDPKHQSVIFENFLKGFELK